MKQERKLPKKNIYHIILVNLGKHVKNIDLTDTEKKAYSKLKALIKENESVQFPRKYSNHEHSMLLSDYELIIIKKKELGDDEVNNLKSDMGNYVGYRTDNENWVVVDRAPYKVEETFWVYGYHPRLQRKTYQWILDNFIIPNGKDKTIFKTVQVYNNKLLIESNGDFDMVICKTKDDSIRLYNMIESFSIKNKFKSTLFMGDIADSSYKGGWIRRIMEKTGWNEQKVQRLSTRD